MDLEMRLKIGRGVRGEGGHGVFSDGRAGGFAKTVILLERSSLFGPPKVTPIGTSFWIDFGPILKPILDRF